MSDRGALAARLRRPSSQNGPHRSYDGPTVASLAVLVGVLVLNLLQQPGRITFDTKLDLQLAPWEFLSRSLSLWNPDSALGGLQNQASGYLFPMGPAFVLGDQLGVPVWVWERLWSALVMLVAYEGARRLARSWPGVGGWGAVVAGLAYLAAPRVLTTVGALSGETLPGAVLPWTVLPLVMYLRGTWRRAPALVLSAVSVLFMGGQNATLVVACLILPGLLLLASAGRPVRRVVVDLVGWSLLVVAATLWWLVPLVLLGSYAPPFLDFIESSRTTAGRTGWLTSLRGTNHWVAYFSDGGPSGWLGGWQLATSSVLLVTTTLVALLGLIGLARGRLALRGPLLFSLLVGLAFLTLGSGGWAGSLLAGPWLDALDTWLAPLRNVHKFDPLVRLPLSLGVGAFVTTVVPHLASGLATRLSTRLPGLDERRAATGLVTITVLLVLAAAQPAVAGHLRGEDGFEALPDEWRQAAAWLDSVPGPVGVLVLPGSGFAVQEWGRTVDEPIQVLGGPPWAGRAQVTVAPPGTLRVLDALERRMSEGRPVPNVSEVLRRLGITHVLVRDDLDPDDSDAPTVEVVRAALSGDLDLKPVAAFDTGAGAADPRLEIYQVEDGGDRRVALQRWDERLTVDGAPEAVLDLVGAGILSPGQAMTVDTQGSAETDVVTDGNRRVERSFGRVHGALSAVMTPEDEFRFTRPKHDYVGDDVPAEQTVAAYEDLVQVVASSSAGYADTFGRVQPEEHPYAAVDPSPFTSWATDPFSDPEGQWLELRLPEPRDLGAMSAQLDLENGVRVRSLELVTDSGSRTVTVAPNGAVRRTTLPEGATSRLRVVVADVSGGRRQVRLSDLRVDGLDTSRTLRMPGTLEREGVLHVRAETPQRACFGVAPTVTCLSGRQVETPETAGFSRTFDVAEPGTWEVRGWAVATHGATLAALLAPFGEGRVRVEASSTFGGDPAVAPVHAHDGESGTSWYAAESDRTPVLDLAWDTPRRIRSVLASLAPDAPGRLPDAFVVDPVVQGEQPQLVDLTGPDAGQMDPVRTTRLRLTAVVEDDGEEDPEGIGISELSIAGIEDLRHRPDPAAETGVLCGFGPAVTVAGQRIRLGVQGTVQDVVDGGRLALTSCGPSRVELPAGEHRLEVRNEAGFSVSELVLRPRSAEVLGGLGGGAGVAAVRSWGPVERSVEVRAAKEAVLTVPESFNAGWAATLAGDELEPVRVDGWKQGWIVPEGSTGLVLLTYTPQESFALGLGAGAGLAAVLVVAAGLLWRRRSRSSATSAGKAGQRRTASGRSAPLGRVAALLVVVVSALVSVPLAVGVVLGVATGRVDPARRKRLLLVGVALLPLAAALTLVVGSPLSPSAAADGLVALAVGLAVGLGVRTDRLEAAAPQPGTAGTP